MVEIEHRSRFVEKTHHDSLAELGRNGRYTDVDVFSGDLQTDTTILRKSFLCDVQTGHDLDAGDDSRLERFVLTRNIVQHSVDTEPNLESILKRLDMHVRGALRARFEDDSVDVPNDRRVIVIGVGYIDLKLGREILFVFAIGVAEVARAVGHEARSDRVNRFRYLVRRGDKHLNRTLVAHSKLVDSLNVERIGGGHHNVRVIPTYWDRQELTTP